MLIDHERLTAVSTGILHAAGAPEDHARLVSEHLVDANLKGHDSHGIGMVPSYVRGIMDGLVAADRHAELTVDNGAVLSFDAGRAWAGSWVWKPSSRASSVRPRRGFAA